MPKRVGSSELNMTSAMEWLGVRQLRLRGAGNDDSNTAISLRA